MSTLRNKTLVKRINAAYRQNDAMTCTSRNVEECGSDIQENKISSSGEATEEEKRLNMSVASFKKITNAFVMLRDNNRKLARYLQFVSSHYKKRYEIRVKKLRLSLFKKLKKIQNFDKIAQNDDGRKKCMIILRFNNKLLFCNSHEDALKNKCFAVVVYKISENPKGDKLLCESIAKSTYGEKVIVTKKLITFLNSVDADKYVSDLQKIFNEN
ncbi:unknown [Euproctis pseudoconspersa nucleopolyhedrovirus]|uniref:Uncharacterized protein n=1 Tax=Euproctis pseudoconspersa nucleopolyhedrovirus TaxID=307467 RepID=C3TX39_9ABAC|nr:hypothetical protein EupsNPV_gp131 [Euproctis pseudoconspersa nucleopolyhedrovirus]ACO53581.1 unknown [Euproctis pseudoconspersa nucleopolyhedrovirus]QUJ09321.1 hypothetical protein Gyru_ORF126 [Gynaephora ruoergensis nucleopolyhedrovirus]